MDPLGTYMLDLCSVCGASGCGHCYKCGIVPNPYPKTLGIKIAQKPYIVWSLFGPKSLNI